VTPQQPVHVEDLVAAILAALASPAAARGEYDLGGPEPIALRQVIAECARALGRPAWVLPLPLAPAHHAAVLARRLRLPFPVSPEQVLRLTESKAVDIGPARRDLGFSPRSFREGIEGEVALMRSHPGPGAGSRIDL
jgi:nucleoside-diphosphate-sugar epimerase